MGNSTLHRPGVQEDGTSAPHINSLAWKFGVDPQKDDDDDDKDDNDDDYSYHDDDDDGMFHGLFCMGSKVLTELELESPVEESKITATPIRTPRRSNNSSRTSSTRELDFGSPQACFLDSESCSLTPDAMTVSMSSPGCNEGRSVIVCLSPSHEQMEHISTVSSPDGKEDAKVLSSELAPLYRLDEQSLEPSRPSPDGKLFPRKSTSWNDKRCQAMVGAYSANCRTVKKGKSALALTCRAGGSCVDVPEGPQAESPIGSLPDGSKSILSSRGQCIQDNGMRRVRSLTDKDFNELRGFIDLGFVFRKDNIPDFCGTLPALEVCYAIAHGPNSPLCNMEDSTSVSPGSPSVSPWKVVGPGDQPHQVKARLRHWAQAVACNVRQAR